MYKAINIGSLKINDPVFLCPLVGITDLPYRTMIREFGAGMVYSEMISSLSLIANSEKTYKMIEFEKSKGKFGVQLSGSNIEAMCTSAKINADRGVDLIDVNMGCPAKKVVSGIAGAALMKEELLVGRLIEELVKSVDIPITVKMRLGWSADNLNASKLAHIVQEAGAQLVTVHGRTRQQFFSGECNLEEIAKVKQSVSIPVIANGDIKTVYDAKKVLEITKADGIMVGRGTYGKPWILKHMIDYLNSGVESADPSINEIKQYAFKHYDLMLDFYGAERGLRIARKHLSHYTKGLRNSCNFRAKLNISNSVTEVKDLLYMCFENATLEGSQAIV